MSVLSIAQKLWEIKWLNLGEKVDGNSRKKRRSAKKIEGVFGK